jgi:hypothetical protein
MFSFFWVFVAFVGGGMAGIVLMALMSVAGNAAERPNELRKLGPIVG